MSMHDIVGVNVDKVAITEVRLLIERQDVKAMGGKVLHIKAEDQLQNIDPELRGHRSETELDSPEVKELRDAYSQHPGSVPTLLFCTNSSGSIPGLTHQLPESHADAG
jgi:hypothetical protein